MSTFVAIEPRKPLADRLVHEALLIVVATGPSSLSLREVQRRAGVSPAAAYRHFRDRDALLLAVAQEAAGVLADHLSAAIEEIPLPDGDLVAARHRLRAACEAYVDFATHNPGLYRSIFYSNEDINDMTSPAERSRGESGDGGYNILIALLQDVMTASGGRELNPWEPTVIWSTLHGLAMLRLDAALRFLPTEQFAQALDRALGTICEAVPLETIAHR